MRELKFRAWCKLNSKWLEPDQGDNDWPMLLAIGLHGLPICIDKDSIKQGEIVGWNRDHNIELVQFTGLTDKNGVEIYEGDIVDDKFDCGQLKIISWDNEKACFIDTTIMKPPIYKNMKPHSCPLSISTSTITGGKVIGNIHENAELLK